MVSAVPLLVLLFFMCGVQSQNTQTEVQTESQSTEADSEVTTNLDVFADLSELRDGLRELGATVVALRMTLSSTQDELQDSKAQLFKVAAEAEVLRRENSAQEAELAALQYGWQELKRENTLQTSELSVLTVRLASSDVQVEKLQNETSAQQRDLIELSTELDHLKKESSAHQQNITMMKSDVETLKRKNSVHEDNLTFLTTELQHLKKENSAQEESLAMVQTEVKSLQKEFAEQPKVAFSAALPPTGYINAGSKVLDLVFSNVITNVGQAYSNSTGFFTASVKGVYYFRFTVMDFLSSRWMNAKMFKNGQQVLFVAEHGTDGYESYLSSSVTLQLEVGDVVNMRLPENKRLYCNTNNQSTFSGFLLFPL